MIYYLIILIFIISIAITTGSIGIASHLKATFQSELFSTLLYFLAFYFTFGFYALWGELLVATLLQSFVEKELLVKLTDIMVLLGSPFMVFASVMFIKLAREISGKQTRSPFILIYIFANIVVIISIGYALLNDQQAQPLKIMRYYFAMLIFLCTILGIYYLLSPGKRAFEFRIRDKAGLSIALAILLIIQNTLLRFYDKNAFLAQLFIFSFFLYGGTIPIFLKYVADLSTLIRKNGQLVSFEQFCEQHEISQREREIIAEVCQGFTNQQIADRLFISLQTVKDHTHRIYIKTNCANRSQLIRVINECRA